jgi:hypothetical protein
MAKLSTVYIAVVTGDTPAQTIKERHCSERYDNPAMGCEALRNLLERAAICLEDSKVYLFQDAGDGTAATNEIVCTQANATVGETCSIAGVVFTIVTTPSTNPASGEIAAGASDTAFGDNLAAAINAHPALKGLVTAVNTAGSVAVTAVDKGPQGNLITLAETGDAFAVSGATLEDGAIGTLKTEAKVYIRGL